MVRSYLRSLLSETSTTQEVDTCSLRWIAAGKGRQVERAKELRRLKKKKKEFLAHVCCQGSFHYGNRCCSSLFAICGNEIYIALARRVAITLGYEELGSNLCPRGPEARSSEFRVLLSMEIPMQDGSPHIGVSAITRGVLTP